jgi:transitional endoplasmic reticulum ATPase
VPAAGSIDVDALMTGVEEQRQQKARTANRADQIRAASMAVLNALGGLTVQDDELTFEGTKIILPAQYEGNVGKVIEYLDQWRRDQAKMYDVNRKFPFRPYDVAAAFDRTLRAISGASGLGVTRQTMFGPEPPAFITVPISLDDSIQVPWGLVKWDLLDCTFDIGYTNTSEDGIVGYITANLPKRNRAMVEGFFMRVEEELKTNSIYKGKAINGAQHPEFIDIGVDPKKVVYSDEVMTEIETHVWLPLRHPDAVRAAGLKIKRHVLLEGPFGTGKTLMGMLTAQEAIKAGYTFIQVRPGKDDLFAAIQTARIYGPAVLWFEDLDTRQDGDEDFVSKLLEALDGIQAKNGEVMAVFTTNYVERIQKGVMRPGRLDAVIRIGPLDASGYERLVKAHIPENLLGEIDYAQVATAFDGYPPAFNVEIIQRTIRYALARTEGHMVDKITTEDLVHAAAGMKRQLELMEGAREGASVPTIDGLLEDMIADQLVSHNVNGWSIEANDEDE